MNFHQFVAAVNSTSVFSITANPGPRGVVFTLRTSKVLNTTHFKTLAKLSPANGYDYKNKAFVFTAKVDNFTGELVGAEKLLAVIEAAASSRETTKVALAERKKKAASKAHQGADRGRGGAAGTGLVRAPDAGNAAHGS